MEPGLRKGINVTTDNLFTFLELARGLKKKKSHIVGTMNKARKELLPSANAGALFDQAIQNQ